MSPGCKLLLPALSLAMLCGCPSPPRLPPPPQTLTPAATLVPAPHLGTPYEIVPQSSLLTILVYRGGTLASAGHNHVVASHDLSGAIYIPSDILRSSFEVHIPVATLTVDESQLRARQPAAEFPPDVPESAKEGTRRNMLGETLLDAQHNPEIVLQAVQLEPGAGVATSADSGAVLAHVLSTVRGQARSFTVPIRYQRGSEDTLEISGDFPLRQTDLGLTPFSAMLGALQVQDEMRVSLRIVAHAAGLETAPLGTP